MSSRQLFLVASACVAVALALPASASAALTARYTYTPSNPLAEMTTTFDGSASVCDRKPCAYAWRDDGSDGPGGASTLLGTGTMLYHKFHTAGDKFIRLTVTNRKGRANSTVRTINVSAAPPADGDGDGVADGQDSCPTVAGSPPNGCPAPTPPPPDQPSSVVYVAPTDGAQVSGVTGVRVRAPAGTDWIGVYACGGQSVGEDLAVDASGEWSVQWDTRMSGCSNGGTRIDTWSYRDDGSETGYAARNVTINNTSLPPPPPASTSCDPTAAPAPISGQGYTMRYSDCFGTLDRSTWCNRQWWESSPPAGTQFVQDGVLHLLRRRADGFQNTTMSTEPCGQANPRSFKQGYFEARMFWPGVQGAGPAFWMLSTAHATNPRWPSPGCPGALCLSSELDVFEGYGRYPGVFTGTLHRNSCGCYNEPNRTNGNSWQPQGSRVADSWHTYAALWTQTEVRWYLDGQFSHSTPVWDSTDQPMHLILSHWNTPWQSDNAVNSSTPDVMDVGVDWVRVWQK